MKRENFAILPLLFTAVMIGVIGASTSTSYGELTDQIWTYNDPSYITETTNFGDGDTVYVEVTDSVTTGSPKTITVQNKTVGNEISVEVNEVTETVYRGSLVVYSGANDDGNDKLALFTGQTATITADLADDGSEGTKTISFVEYKEFLSLNFVQSVARRDGPAKIILRVSEPADITIYLFNLTGKIVYKWNDYVTSEVEWLWTGVNMYGERVNNGTYICKITAKADGSTVNRTKILGVLY
ncbi:MAG: hypothetical protein U9O41_08050 [Candidatus Aerophobetes bacterium]|nr:hypothetical protein [Candidatus Aerophobetes bacterium]